LDWDWLLVLRQHQRRNDQGQREGNPALHGRSVVGMALPSRQHLPRVLRQAHDHRTGREAPAPDAAHCRPPTLRTPRPSVRCSDASPQRALKDFDIDGCRQAERRSGFVWSCAGSSVASDRIRRWRRRRPISVARSAAQTSQVAGCVRISC